MMTFFAPMSDSTVRSIKSSRACTSTWSHTSSGTRFSSMSRRLNVNSVLDADGKPTSISLKPIFTSVWNNSSFCDTFIGTASAWLPSRKSTLHQRGAAVSTRLGHWRSANATGGNGRYFLDGSVCIVVFQLWQWRFDLAKQKPHRRVWQWGSLNRVSKSEPDHRAGQ